MKLTVLSLFFAAAAVGQQPAPMPTAYDVRAFGAAGDGKTLDHAAIDRAIDAASRAGGGIVRLPAGTYLCFSVHLQSNVTLQFEPGATILAASPATDGGRYDAAEPNPADPYEDFGHSHWHNSLLWGENLHHVAIVGPGLIHGEGLSRGWGADTIDALPADSPERLPPRPKPRFNYPNPKDTLRDGVGNKAIALKNCRDVTLRDFSVLHGGHFAILATGVDNLSIDHLKLDTNRDGMDIDACRNVRVTDCSVNSPWDDGICLKSSYGLGAARDTENVTITGCMSPAATWKARCFDATWQRHPPGEADRPHGRIKFGTESNGGFRRIAIANCIFEHCKGWPSKRGRRHHRGRDGQQPDDARHHHVADFHPLGQPPARAGGHGGGRDPAGGHQQRHVFRGAGAVWVDPQRPAGPSARRHPNQQCARRPGRRRDRRGRRHPSTGKSRCLPGSGHVRDDALLGVLRAPRRRAGNARHRPDAGEGGPPAPVSCSKTWRGRISRACGPRPGRRDSRFSACAT